MFAKFERSMIQSRGVRVAGEDPRAADRQGYNRNVWRPPWASEARDHVGDSKQIPGSSAGPFYLGSVPSRTSGKDKDPNNFANNPEQAAEAGRKGGHKSHKRD